jgi:hypothetical protein
MRTIGAVIVLIALMFVTVFGAVACSSEPSAADLLDSPTPTTSPTMSGDLTRLGTGWCATPCDLEAALRNT